MIVQNYFLVRNNIYEKMNKNNNTIIIYYLK